MTISELYKVFEQHPFVSTDTRKITPNSLFFALKGDNFDANNFAAQALNSGAAFAIVDNPEVAISNQYILVKNTLETLQNLATYYRQKLNIPVIGLTGSNGKTTTKELVKSILSQKYITSATIGNLNNHIGVPLTLLAITKNVEIAIVEMGANHQKEIAELCNIAKPNYGLITNVGKAHLEGFGGFEGVKKGKGELYSFLEENKGTVFINSDNQHLKKMSDNKVFKEVVYYGESNINFISGRLIANNPFLEIEWTNHKEVCQIKSQLTGTYNFENLLSAITVGVKFGLNPDQINNGISSYQPQNNRSQIIKTKSNTIIGDFYNANPSSMQVAIENIAALDARKKILILGDMFELGNESHEEHKLIIDKANFYPFDKVVFIGKTFYNVSVKNKGVFYFQTLDFKNFLKENPINDALILVKGSRGMHLEDLLENL
jgi:UDP-N-acetylmuramoyl-tripeptide--D-alanyl-D-alanine ligase